MAFTPINTQEEFDAAIKDRIDRAEKSAESRIRSELQKDLDEAKSIKDSVQQLTAERDSFKNKLAEQETAVSSLQQQLTAEKSKVKGYETDSLKLKIAQEIGIPLEARSRLNGETEEDIRKDAESFKNLFRSGNNRGLPSFEGGEGGFSGSDDSQRKQELKNMLGKIRKGE